MLVQYNCKGKESVYLTEIIINSKQASFGSGFVSRSPRAQAISYLYPGPECRPCQETNGWDACRSSSRTRRKYRHVSKL